MQCIANSRPIFLCVRTVEHAFRLAIFVVGILALANAGITQEALGWSCLGLGVASLILRIISFHACNCWEFFDTLFLMSTLVVALLGATHLISFTDVAWTMVGLNTLAGALFFYGCKMTYEESQIQPTENSKTSKLKQHRTKHGV